jgi:hypothetical protein
MREQQDEVIVSNPVEVLDNVDDDLDCIELWTTALSCFQNSAPEYTPQPKGMVASILGEARLAADVTDPASKPTEVFDSLDDDLDRIELWTAPLNCLHHPARKYESENVRSGELDITVRGLNEARDRAADDGDRLQSGQARDGASQVVDADGISMNVQRARNTASPIGDVMRNTIESQPYIATAIALGLGLLLGRMHRPL